VRKSVTCFCGLEHPVTVEILGKTIPCPNCARPLRIPEPRPEAVQGRAPRESARGVDSESALKLGFVTLIAVGALLFIGLIALFYVAVRGGDEAAGGMPPALADTGPRPTLPIKAEAPADPRAFLESLRVEMKESPTPVHTAYHTAAQGGRYWEVVFHGDPIRAQLAVDSLYRDPLKPAQVLEMLDLRHRIYKCQRELALFVGSYHRRFRIAQAAPLCNIHTYDVCSGYIAAYDEVIRKLETRLADRLTADPEILARALRPPPGPFMRKACDLAKGRRDLLDAAAREALADDPPDIERLAALGGGFDPSLVAPHLEKLLSGWPDEAALALAKEACLGLALKQRVEIASRAKNPMVVEMLLADAAGGEIDADTFRLIVANPQMLWRFGPKITEAQYEALFRADPSLIGSAVEQPASVRAAIRAMDASDAALAAVRKSVLAWKRANQDALRPAALKKAAASDTSDAARDALLDWLRRHNEDTDALVFEISKGRPEAVMKHLAHVTLQTRDEEVRRSLVRAMAESLKGADPRPANAAARDAHLVRWGKDADVLPTLVDSCCDNRAIRESAEVKAYALELVRKLADNRLVAFLVVEWKRADDKAALDSTLRSVTRARAKDWEAWLKENAAKLPKQLRAS